ncbi:MAG TPA: carbohydrate ABC transporter permease [Chloroflexota bacterium]
MTVAAKPTPVTAGRISWRQRRTVRTRISQTIIFIVLALLSILFIAPVVWMFVSALKPNLQILDGRWIPQTWDWSNFSNAWREAPFGAYARNTLIVSFVSVAGNVLSSSLVAYSFARLRWPGREVVFVIVLATMLIPSIVLFVPQFILWSKLGYVDTWVPLTVPAWFGSPFYIFLLRQFYRGIPTDLTDAARIDGAGELRIWWQVVMPLARPALTAVAIFAFTGAWEDFFGPLIYLSTESKFTLQLGLQVFEASGGGIPQWNYLMAVGFIIMLPVIALFFIGQRYFIEGVTLTGLKG